MAKAISKTVQSVTTAGFFAKTVISSCLLSAIAVEPAMAQLEEVVVTARKREESILETPVVIQAFSAEKLDKFAIATTEDLGYIAPNLIVQHSTGGVGAIPFLRGLGNGGSASFIEPSVLLNVDGVPLLHGAFYKAGLFDVAQVEVLKGPQALYFGKSSSAGIVSVISAGPTDEFEATIKTRYNFEFEEWRTEGSVSGPLGDSGFGYRLGGFYTDSDQGWIENKNPTFRPNGAPVGEEWGGRLTLNYDNNGRFRAVGKYTRFESEMLGNLAGENNIMCASGNTPQSALYPYEDCKLNEVSRSNPGGFPYDPIHNYMTDNPNASPLELQRNGDQYSDSTIEFSSLRLDFDLKEDITLTSVTGMSSLDTEESITAISPGIVRVEVPSNFKKDDISQEFRLESNFDGRMNFMAGAFYSEGDTYYRSSLGLPNLPLFSGGPQWVENIHELDARSWSVFVQVDYDLTPELELSIGARYTDDKKEWDRIRNRKGFTVPFFYALFGPDGDQLDLLNPEDRKFTEDNLSPEVTLTWTPRDGLMIYGAYKEGYKGPGYNAATVNYTQDPNNMFAPADNSPYGGEEVQGGELGLKTSLLDGQLNITSAIYYYKYEGLQVSFVENSTFLLSTNNAADATVRGFEIGADYLLPGIDGLLLSAFVNYNDGYYNDFDSAACYVGQTPEQGCVDGSQDLGGETLHRAPEWTGSFGVDYTLSMADVAEVNFLLNGNFASDYNILPEQSPVAEENGYLTLDATVAVSGLNSPWEVALIWRNITNEFYAYSGSDLGGNDFGVVGPNGPDSLAYVNKQRSISLQVGYTFR